MDDIDEKKLDGIVKRMLHLKRYVDLGYTYDQVRDEYLAKRALDALTPKTEDKSYETTFRTKMQSLQQEFSVDMNDSNDREMLQSLVRHMLQSEAADKAIRAIHEKGGALNRMDFLNLKNLGEYQASVDRTVSELQDKLGISRKLRKEKSSDELPQWMAGVRKKAKELFDRKTTAVECPKCSIELFRFWENFKTVEVPTVTEGKLISETKKNKIVATLICWKCHETIMFNK